VATLYDKIWDAHCVETGPEEQPLLSIDLHLLHEISTPQAFAGLVENGRTVRRPDRTLAVIDHNVPTERQEDGPAGIADPEARLQIETLRANVAANAVPLFDMGDIRNGIVHIVGPEQGRTLPGMTIVCGDSHTSTHGAFGALAHGIGTSEVEHVLATQTLRQRKSRNLRVTFAGTPSEAIGGKDMALAMIRQLGAAGGTGFVIEYAGRAVRALSMEGRMTLCNMSIEAGARAGLIAPDETTFAYLRSRLAALSDAQWGDAVSFWRSLATEPAAAFDREEIIDLDGLAPMVTWGTSPEDALQITERVPDPADWHDAERRAAASRALDYMGLEAGAPIAGTPIDVVFVGSCTNGRIEDIRAAARVAAGRRVADGVRALVVPGSGLVKRQAEDEGLDRILLEAGFEWRQPGCSMCLGMNPDRLRPQQRSASTSNRNFEGRQGRGGRTHLMSPLMAAAAAVTGRIADVRDLI
jgi:3-isopropylmalate/(R)-2-methylmalate dehydratase large subunit